MKIGKVFISVYMFIITVNTWAQNENIITILPGNTVDLSAESSNATDYLWFYNGVNIPGEYTSQYEASAEGFYAVIAYNEYGCPSAISNEIEIRYNVPPPKAENKYTFCLPKKIYPDSILIKGENIQWYKQDKPETLLPKDKELTTGYYLVTQVVEGIESDPRLIYIELIDCSDLLSISKFASDINPSIYSTITFTIQLKNLSEKNVANISVKESFPSGFKYKSHTAQRGVFNPQTGIWSISSLKPLEEVNLLINAQVNPAGNYINKVHIAESSPIDYMERNNSAQIEVKPTCLFVYNEFSPNEDGKNDKFMVECIEKYPHNVLQIFSRQGQLVYEKKRYQNTWEGITNQQNNLITKGALLPAGTYYYVLKLNDELKPLKGWLYIAY